VLHNTPARIIAVYVVDQQRSPDNVVVDTLCQYARLGPSREVIYDLVLPVRMQQLDWSVPAGKLHTACLASTRIVRNIMDKHRLVRLVRGKAG